MKRGKPRDGVNSTVMTSTILRVLQHEVVQQDKNEKAAVSLNEFLFLVEQAELAVLALEEAVGREGVPDDVLVRRILTAVTSLKKADATFVVPGGRNFNGHP